MHSKSYSILLFFLVLYIGVGAQEMNYTVSVNAQKALTVDQKVFKTLENTIIEFLNNQKWTDDFYQPEERIEGSIFLTINEEVNPTTFSAELLIQATRPIYGSSQKTLLVNHLDKNIRFSYQEGDPLQFSQTKFTDNLSATLAFYTYVILGMDYDSFSLFGGEKYFQAAQDIVNTLPQNVSNDDAGWNQLKGDQNRFWIIENILEPRVRPYRQAMYDYHRQSLDLMNEDMGTARAIMAEAIDNIAGVNQAYPNSIIIRMFVNAKADEIVEIFKRGGSTEKNNVIRFMSKMDAANAAKYRQIR